MPLPPLEDTPGIRERILPAGTYSATVEEIRETFVSAFPASVRRPLIYQGWTQFRALVRRLVPVQSEFIDGSFVTDRLNPDDIDLSLWVRASDIDSLPPNDALALEAVMGRRFQFLCDAYLVPICDEGHRLYPHFTWIKEKTARYWAAYKDLNDEVIPGITKGYVEVSA